MENRNISAEIRPVEDRFLRLLEILAGPNKKDKGAGVGVQPGAVR